MEHHNLSNPNVLSDQEMLRYHRQITLKSVDFEGQERLKASRVLIVGLGGLGCAAAQSCQ